MNRRGLSAAAALGFALFGFAFRAITWASSSTPGTSEGSDCWLELTEGAAADAALLLAGVRPGDHVLAWRRGDVRGDLCSLSDGFRLETEEGPRGGLVAEVEREGERLELTIPAGSWEASTRPRLAGAALARAQEVERHSHAGELRQAAELAASSALRGDPSGAWFSLVAARAWAGAAESEKARAALEVALAAARDPRDEAELWLRLADSARRSGALDLAEAAIAEAERRLVGDEESLLRARAAELAGRVAEARGDLERAAASYERADSIRSHRAPESLERASSLAALGNLARARGDLPRAAESLAAALALTHQLVPDGVANANRERDLGIVLRLRGRLDEAEERLNRAREVHERLAPDSLDLASTLGGLGTIAMVRGDMAGGEALYRRALAIQERLAPERLEVASTLNNVGNTLRLGGRLDEAEEVYTRSMAIYERLARDSLPEALVINNLGLLYSARHELDRAEAQHQRALAIRERWAPQTLDHAASLRNLGIVAFERGDLALAGERFGQSLAIEERMAPGSPAVAGSLNNLGLVASTRGDLERSEQYHLRALEIYERSAAEGVEHSYVLTNLGLVAFFRGAYERAADYQRRALAIAEKRAPDSRDVAVDLINLGNTAHARGDFAAAEAFYGRALELVKRLDPEGPEVAVGFDNLGLVAAARGRLEEAVKYHERALELKLKNADGSLVVANTLDNLGELALRRGRLDEAEQRYTSALAIESQLAPGSEREATSLHALGVVARRHGKLEEARSFFARAVVALDLQMGRLGGSEEERVGFRAHHEAFYRDLVEVLLELGHVDRAFSALERSRARSFLTLLRERELLLGAEVPPELERERRTLAVRYDRAQEELAELSPRREKERVETLLGELRSLREELGRVRARLREVAPQAAELEDPVPLGVEEVRSALEPGVVLLAWSVGDKSSNLFVLSRDRAPAVRKITWERDRLEREVATFRELIGATTSVSPRTATLEATARRLYQTLLAPAEDLLAGAQRLLLVPDGALHVLPFGALRLADGRYLAQDQLTSIVPSATAYALLQRRRPKDSAAARASSLAAFADPQLVAPALSPPLARAAERGCSIGPLPAARREIEGIGQLFGAESQLYFGAEASEARVKALPPDVRRAHFATHACLDERRPLDSALVLAADGDRENGLLQAWEVLELRWDADLVVLSACESGLGREMAGEGMLGLTRAFLHSAARSVVASLWKVSDESTAELMIRFYRRLARGATKDEALAEAQRELLAAPNRSAEPGDGPRKVDAPLPYHWAAFQVYGDWR